MTPDEAQPPAAKPPLDSTAVLIDRYRAGDQGARDALFARYLPVL